jgi:hypothetical protein
MNNDSIYSSLTTKKLIKNSLSSIAYYIHQLVFLL